MAVGLALAAWPAIVSAQDGDATTPRFERLDSMQARVQGCTTCHGDAGQGAADGRYPRIAGKPAVYLERQLRAFRDGTRRYAPMNYLVAFLPDAYLADMAEYYASLRPALTRHEREPADAATLARGGRLASQGDPSIGVPACMGCHGPTLTGMLPGIPGLVGLRASYVLGQLTRWRVGERNALAPDCMKRIASRLSDADARAVAAWLERVPPPDDLSPMPADLVRMPLACGSQR